jgi:hypothetical protein
MDIAVFTCVHVLEQHAPILLLSFDTDGYRQFLCGAPSHDWREGRIIGLQEAIALDPSVAAIEDLPAGYVAHRDRIGGPWRRGPIPAEDDP